MSEPKFVDLAATKTEAQWQASIDRFWLAATPEIFKWLGWVAALATLSFIQQKSPSIVVSALRGVCYVAMIFYFNAFFYQFVFLNPPFMKSAKGRWFVSLAISGALAYLAIWFAREAMLVFATARP